MRAHEGGYFVRLTVIDEAGVFASVATRMAEQKISLQSIVQNHRDAKSAHGGEAKEAQPIILITHETTEQAIRQALANIEKDGHLEGPPQMIRIEK